MPVISINLSERAYDVYRTLKKGHRSQVMSAALMQWKAQVEEDSIVSKRYRDGDI